MMLSEREWYRKDTITEDHWRDRDREQYGKGTAVQRKRLVAGNMQEGMHDRKVCMPADKPRRRKKKCRRPAFFNPCLIYMPLTSPFYSAF